VSLGLLSILIGDSTWASVWDLYFPASIIKGCPIHSYSFYVNLNSDCCITCSFGFSNRCSQLSLYLLTLRKLGISKHSLFLRLIWLHRHSNRTDILAHYSDKMKTRSPFIMTGLFMALVGLFINVFKCLGRAKYFGTFLCVAGSYSPSPVFLMVRPISTPHWRNTYHSSQARNTCLDS